MPPPPANADDFKITAPPTRRAEGWRRLFPVFVTRTDHGWEVEVWWWRLMVSLGLSLVLTWMTLSAGAFFFLKYKRGFTTVCYTDILLCFLPSHWEAYQVARGDFFIQQAKEALAKGKGREAKFDLEVGTTMSPANQAGTLLLAEFFAATRRPDLAWNTLRNGLAYHRADPDYLKEVFSFLTQQEMDTEAIAVARSLLPKEPVLTPRNQIIALAGARACFYRGNFDQAEDFIRLYGLEHFRDGLLLLIRIEWERGDHAAALGDLHRMAAIPGLEKDAEIYNQTIAWLHALGREDEARNESRLRQLADPGNPFPRIDQLAGLKQDGDETALRETIESILRDFATNDAALFALADFAANTGDVALAHRIYLHCKEDTTGHLNWENAALMEVEANIRAKKFQAALDLSSQLLAANPSWSKRYFTVFNGLQAIAYFGLGDDAGGRLALTNFINQPGLNAKNLLAVASRLLDVGARADARRVLAKAVQTDPLSQPALTNLIKLDLEFNDADALADHLDHLTKMRKPSLELLQAAFDKLGGDLFLFRSDRTVLLQKVGDALHAAKVRLSVGTT